MELYCHEVDKDVMVLRADGGLNAQTADQLVGDLEKLVDGGIRKIIVDCSGLEYVSSYGLAVLVRLHRALWRHGGDVRLAGVKGVVATIIEMSRLNQIFSLYPDVDRARLSFRPPTK